jgi:hypothetical protein
MAVMQGIAAKSDSDVVLEIDGHCWAEKFVEIAVVVGIGVEFVVGLEMFVVVEKRVVG